MGVGEVQGREACLPLPEGQARDGLCVRLGFKSLLCPSPAGCVPWLCALISLKFSVPVCEMGLSVSDRVVGFPEVPPDSVACVCCMTTWGFGPAQRPLAESELFPGLQNSGPADGQTGDLPKGTGLRALLSQENVTVIGGWFRG